MTVTQGLTLGIIGTCLTIGGWVFAMWIYTKNQKENETKKKADEEYKKLFSD
jgi:hypothetical protein